MKKTLLSVVLCVALLITAMGTMLAMPASAAEGYDFLWYASAVYGSDESVDFSYADGQLVFNATAEGQEVILEIPEDGNLNLYPFYDLEIDATVGFDLCFHDVPNDKWMFGAGDFCYDFETNNGPGNPLPAGKHSARIDLTGAYRWNPETNKMDAVVPANASIRTLAVIAKGAGTITLTKAQLTDGMEDFDVNSRGDQSGLSWDKSVSLIQGDYVNHPAPNPDDPQSNVTVKQDANGNWVYGNDNGQWPAASYTYDTPIVVNDSAAIEMDFTVTQGSNTTIYIFFKDDTPGSYNNGTYMYIANKDKILDTDLPCGNYKGILFLDDMVERTIGNIEKGKADCLNADGKYVITGIKIFGTNNSRTTDEAVIIRKFNLLSLKDNEEKPSTTQPTTATTKATMKPPAYVETTTTAQAVVTTTTQAVTTDTTAAPSDDTTDAPSDDTTDAPSDDTTEAPSDDTTDAPSDDTTAATKGDSTTAATKGDSTTAATKGDSTTAATEAGATTAATEAGATTAATETAGSTTAAADGALPTTGADGSVNTTVADTAATTANQAGSVGGNSAPTGDTTNAALFLVIALAAAGVVTFSVLSGKKAKN